MMMNIWKKLILVLVSFLLILSTKGIVYAAESNQVYVGDFNLYTYRADLYLETDSTFNKTIQNMMTSTTPSELIVEQLNSKASFQKAVNIWKGVHYVTSPSEIAKGGIDEKGYYTAIILSVLKAQTESEHFIFDVTKAIHSNTNKILSNTKKLIKESDEILLDTFHRNQIINTFTIEEQSIIRAYFEGEFKETHPILNKFSTVSSDLAAIFNAVDTLGEAVELMESYVQMLEMSENMKAVLMELYNQCPNSNAMLKEALYETALSTENLENAFCATFLNTAGAQTVEVLGVLIDEGWETLIKLNPYAKAFMVGAEVGTWLGDTVCNTLFSTDKTIEQYEKMKCLCEFTDLLKVTVVNMGNAYLNDKTTERAANYFAAIDVLFSAKILGCDFANNYAEILYEDATLGWVGIAKVEYEEYVGSVKLIKGYYGDNKDSLVRGYLIELECDYPEIYQILMGLDEEESIAVTEITFEQDEIVIGLEDSYIYSVGGVDIVPVNATNSKVTFSSSDISIVSVNETGGWLIPYRVGTAYITATSEDGGFTDVIMIQVVEGKSGQSAAVDIPRVADYGMCGENAEWTYYDGGLLVISGSGEMWNYETRNPSPWNDFNVTKVIVGNEITSIGKRAFYSCKKLERIKLPMNLKSIGEYAFSYCENMIEINIPEGITSIEEGTFLECDYLKSIKIPSSVTKIGERAFYDCSCLKEVDIPKSVVDIGGSAFYFTRWIENKRKENTLVVVNGILIDGNECVGDIVIPQNVVRIGDDAFHTAYDRLTGIEIPSGVEVIGKNAFKHCNKLTTVKFSEGLKKIEDNAFMMCSSLTTIELPESVTSIGIETFYASGLTKIKIPRNVISIGTGVFRGCSNLSDVELTNVEMIGESAFEDCTNLKEIELPFSLHCIGESAFAYSGLTDIVIPQSVEILGDFAFCGCKELVNVKLSSNISHIGEYTFRNTSLTSIHIPDGVSSIGYAAFWCCGPLTSIYISDSVSDIDGDVFDSSCIDNLIIYAKVGSYAEGYAKKYKIASAEIVTSLEEFQSSHDYLNNQDSTWLYRVEGAESLKVVFGAECKLGWYDRIEIYDKEDNVIGRYFDAELADQVVLVNGDTVKVRLISIESGTDYGFRVVSVIPNPKDIYDVRFDANGGTNLGLSHKEVEENQTIGTLPTVERAGYTFKGWYTSATGGTKIDENTVITADTTFYAQWEKVITSIEKAIVKLSSESFVYDGSEKKPTVIIALNGKKLVQGTDYTVSYANNTAVGTATVTITGIGNYCESISKNFTISTASINEAKVTLSKSSYTYDGKNKKPSVTIKLGDKTLVKDTDYTVNYKNNKNIGKATVTIKGKGNYTGTLTKTFTINAKKGATFTSGSYKYKVTSSSAVAFTGFAKKETSKVTIPKTVKYGGKTFKVTAVASKALKGKTKV
ncbi:MAG: leucine-rich repeat protein, partial [Agathobacter sp.]|nr:leucine-rich repeat protein [Agathobacter sp.]